jgi:hypothetical protein
MFTTDFFLPRPYPPEKIIKSQGGCLGSQMSTDLSSPLVANRAALRCRRVWSELAPDLGGMVPEERCELAPVPSYG